MKPIPIHNRGTVVPLLALAVLSPLSPLHAQTNGTWTTNGPGNWSDGANWSPGSIASGPAAIADFSTLDIAGDHLVTIDSPFTIGTLVSQDATTLTHSWNLGGAGPLTLDNGASKPELNVINQSLAISTPLAGTNGFSKTGSGNLVLSGGGTLSGNVIVSAGTVQLEVDNGISTGAGLEIFGGAAASRTLDLAGFDQTLSRFVFNATDLPGNLTGWRTSPKRPRGPPRSTFPPGNWMPAQPPCASDGPRLPPPTESARKTASSAWARARSMSPP